MSGATPTDAALDAQILAVMRGGVSKTNAQNLSTVHLPRPEGVAYTIWRRKLSGRLVSLGKRGLLQPVGMSYWRLSPPGLGEVKAPSDAELDTQLLAVLGERGVVSAASMALQHIPAPDGMLCKPWRKVIVTRLRHLAAEGRCEHAGSVYWRLPGGAHGA